MSSLAKFETISFFQYFLKCFSGSLIIPVLPLSQSGLSSTRQCVMDPSSPLAGLGMLGLDLSLSSKVSLPLG